MPSTKWRTRCSRPSLNLPIYQRSPRAHSPSTARTRKPGTFAAIACWHDAYRSRCALCQLFHRGWDQHNTLPKQLPGQAAIRIKLPRPNSGFETARPARRYADCLGREFGRTVYCQESLTQTTAATTTRVVLRCGWRAGIKPGMTHGETDDYGYNIAKDPVHVHDLHATISCLGLDHKRLTYKFQGRHFRLTDVHGTVVKPILA
ncbi:MAG: DUF1501 domain-containing protein [Bryobacteraceae bacterium]